MIVIPAGSFMMGSSEAQGDADEHPQHMVTISEPFAISKFELTFAEWDACAAQGGCNGRMSDNGWGRGSQPLINVTWDEAKDYVAWLSRITGKTYQLLSEAEYEYAARGGAQTVYPWGDDIKPNGQAMANCHGCDSKWDSKQTAPVGSFAAKPFSLHDVVGNVWEWTEDCYHESYDDAPMDGSAWTKGGDCASRIVRGGSWLSEPGDLRSAGRYWFTTDYRDYFVGFRVARILTP
jgi:formylglycine-generating enzyme required for sulfatase activity